MLNWPQGKLTAAYTLKVDIELTPFPIESWSDIVVGFQKQIVKLTPGATKTLCLQ